MDLWSPITQQPRRKRVLLTVETKLRIIERLERGEHFMKLAEEYNIGKTTIRDIYNKKQEYLDFALSSDSYNSAFKRKTLKRSMNHTLDTEVYKWFQSMRAQGEPVTKQVLIENAQRIHKELGMSEAFAASDGWVNGFKGRHGIEHLSIPGERLGDIAPHLLHNDSHDETYDSYDTDFEKVMVDEDDSQEDNKETTLKQIRMLQESMEAQKATATSTCTSSDPLVKYDAENSDSASCSTTMRRVPDAETDKRTEADKRADKWKIETETPKEDLNLFGSLIANEMGALKSQKSIRELKMNIMKMIYDAQEMEERQERSRTNDKSV